MVDLEGFFDEINDIIEEKQGIEEVSGSLDNQASRHRNLRELKDLTNELKETIEDLVSFLSSNKDKSFDLQKIADLLGIESADIEGLKAKSDALDLEMKKLSESIKKEEQIEQAEIQRGQQIIEEEEEKKKKRQQTEGQAGEVLEDEEKNAGVKTNDLADSGKSSNVSSISSLGPKAKKISDGIDVPPPPAPIAVGFVTLNKGLEHKEKISEQPSYKDVLASLKQLQNSNAGQSKGIENILSGLKDNLLTSGDIEALDNKTEVLKQQNECIEELKKATKDREYRKISETRQENGTILIKWVPPGMIDKDFDAHGMTYVISPDGKEIQSIEYASGAGKAMVIIDAKPDQGVGAKIIDIDSASQEKVKIKGDEQNGPSSNNISKIDGAFVQRLNQQKAQQNRIVGYAAACGG